MAAALWALLVAVIYCATVPQRVVAEGGDCLSVDDCKMEFLSKVHTIGHDKETFCMHSEEQIQCLNGAYQGCTPEQQPYALQRITVAKDEHHAECDACIAVASFWFVTVIAALSTFYNRWL